jgi:hypothetical protein
MAPKQNIPLREILYQLSPYQQDVLGQAFRNAPKTFLRFVQEVRGRGGPERARTSPTGRLNPEPVPCTLQKGVGLVTFGVLFFGIKGWVPDDAGQRGRLGRQENTQWGSRMCREAQSLRATHAAGRGVADSG